MLEFNILTQPMAFRQGCKQVPVGMQKSPIRLGRSLALPSLGLVDLIGSKHPVGRSSPQLDGHLVERRKRAILERVPLGSLRRAAAQEDAQAQLAKLKVVLHQ